MEQNEWIVINYTLPREPSRVRVAVWRKLKKVGAVNMQQSMWILPQSDKNFAVLNEIKEDVCQNAGEAFVMRSSVDENSQAVIIQKFNMARDEEYTELLEQCSDFLAEIEKETTRQNFTFAEIEENEEEIDKLKEWYKKIAARDFFGASLREQSKDMLLQCEAVLEGFCNRVYDFTDNA